MARSEPGLLYRVVYWLARTDVNALIALYRYVIESPHYGALQAELLAPKSPFHNCWFMAFRQCYRRELVCLLEYDHIARLQLAASPPGRDPNTVTRRIMSAFRVAHTAYDIFCDIEYRTCDRFCPTVPRGSQFYARAGYAHMPDMGIHLPLYGGADEWPCALLRLRYAAYLLFRRWAQETERHFRAHQLDERWFTVRDDDHGQHFMQTESTSIIHSLFFAAREHASDLELPLAGAGESYAQLMPSREIMASLQQLQRDERMRSYASAQPEWWTRTIDELRVQVETELPLEAAAVVADALALDEERGEAERATLAISVEKYGFAFDPETGGETYRELILARHAEFNSGAPRLPCSTTTL